MRIHLKDATQEQRDRLDLWAREHGPGVALSTALREGLWPSSADIDRWCPNLARKADGASTRYCSMTLAHERMVRAKWAALEARGWVSEATISPQQADEGLQLQREADREAWVAARMRELEQAQARDARDRVEAQARYEYGHRRST